MATLAAREPGPSVTRVLSRTVRRSTRLGSVVIEGYEHVKVVGDLCDRFGPLDAELGCERLRRGEGVDLVLGVVDLCQRLLRGGMGRLGQGSRSALTHCTTGWGKRQVGRRRLGTAPALRRRRACLEQ